MACSTRCRRAGAAADTFTYNPGDPTPYLIDSRELEESLNEDYTALNATRRDALVFTSKPLTRPLEVTGEMSATLWAASDAQGHRLDRHAARRLSRRPRRAGAGRPGAGAIPEGDGPGGAAGAGAGRAVRHRPLVHVEGVRAGPSAAGQHRVGAVPQVRPEPEHRRKQRAGLDLRGGAPAGAARRGASRRTWCCRSCLGDQVGVGAWTLAIWESGQYVTTPSTPGSLAWRRRPHMAPRDRRRSP